MTVNDYLKQNNLINSQNELTERATYLGYTSVNDLINDIQEYFLVDFKTRTIISAFKYLDNPVAVMGDVASDFISIRVYDENSILEDKIPEITWKNNSDKLEGIFQVTNKNITNHIITFQWHIEPKALYHSGKLQFAVRFVNYSNEEGNRVINYNLATQPTTINIVSSLNYISTLNEGDYIFSFENPYLNENNTYVIDGGDIDLLQE